MLPKNCCKKGWTMSNAKCPWIGSGRLCGSVVLENLLPVHAQWHIAWHSSQIKLISLSVEKTQINPWSSTALTIICSEIDLNLISFWSIDQGWNDTCVCKHGWDLCLGYIELIPRWFLIHIWIIGLKNAYMRDFVPTIGALTKWPFTCGKVISHIFVHTSRKTICM